MVSVDIREYCAKNPGLRLRDVFKFLYQSCFGCEHLLTDEERVLAWINEEAKHAGDDRLSVVEPIGGDYCRVHLNILKCGLAPETLCRLFMLSGEKQTGGAEKLDRALEKLRRLAEEEQVPFSVDEVGKGIANWDKTACHHSDEFRERYHPAYRVVRKDLAELLPLLCIIDARARKGRVIVAIDGRCASGKTTLSGKLEQIYDCNVFHMDDFFLRPEQRTKERFAAPGENIDHERFAEEVLVPLRNGVAFDYRKYDFHARRYSEPIYVEEKRVNIVEGSYSMNKNLVGNYDLKVVIDIPKDIQHARILKRNPDVADRFFSEWIPMEEMYFEAFRIYKNADMVLKM